MNHQAVTGSSCTLYVTTVVGVKYRPRFNYCIGLVLCLYANRSFLYEVNGEALAMRGDVNYVNTVCICDQMWVSH